MARAEWSVFIGDVPDAVDEGGLTQLFGRYTSVMSSKVVRGGPKGTYAFVRFSSPDDQQAAIREMNGYPLLGHTLRVSEAQGGKSAASSTGPGGLGGPGGPGGPGGLGGLYGAGFGAPQHAGPYAAMSSYGGATAGGGYPGAYGSSGYPSAAPTASMHGSGGSGGGGYGAGAGMGAPGAAAYPAYPQQSYGGGYGGGGGGGMGYGAPPPSRAPLPFAAPPPPEAGSCTLFIGGLDDQVDEAGVFAAFSACGPVSHISIPRGKNCGFVQFSSRAAAEYALAAMQGQVLGRYRIRLEWGKGAKASGPTFSGSGPSSTAAYGGATGYSGYHSGSTTASTSAGYGYSQGQGQGQGQGSAATFAGPAIPGLASAGGYASSSYNNIGSAGAGGGGGGGGYGYSYSDPSGTSTSTSAGGYGTTGGAPPSGYGRSQYASSQVPPGVASGAGAIGPGPSSSSSISSATATASFKQTPFFPEPDTGDLTAGWSVDRSNAGWAASMALSTSAALAGTQTQLGGHGHGHGHGHSHSHGQPFSAASSNTPSSSASFAAPSLHLPISLTH